MRVLVCDDETCYTDAISASIQRWEKNNSISALSVDIFSSSEDLLEHLSAQVQYDLVFLDIQFPHEMNGLDLAKELRSRNEQMTLVFMSNYEEYAVDGYRVNAHRFLQKPISDADVFECLDIAYRQWRLLCDTYVLLSDNQKMFRIAYKSIYYIESRAHYVVIHRVQEEDVCLRGKLSDILQSLPEEMFVRSHRSFVVNLCYVQGFAKSFVITTGDLEIPMSTKYREELLARFKDFFQGRKQ